METLIPEPRISEVVPEDEVWLISIKDGVPVVHKIVNVVWDEKPERVDTLV